MKSADYESLEISQQHQVWSTTKRPTETLNAALKTNHNVILIFSVTMGGGFQGFARVLAGADTKYKEEIFKRTYNCTIKYCGNFRIEWVVKQVQFPYSRLNGFPNNPLNQGFTIMQSCNGQELTESHGNYICS
jgi:hypothetical protein